MKHRASRVRVFSRTLLCVASVTLLVQYGVLRERPNWVSLVTIPLATFLIQRRFSITLLDMSLTDTTLTGPVRKGLVREHTIALLQDVDLTKSKMTQFSDSYVALKDGTRIFISRVGFSFGKRQEIFSELTRLVKKAVSSPPAVPLPSPLGTLKKT
jgi:hypothetical protein